MKEARNRRAATASLAITLLLISAIGLSLFAGAASAGNGKGKGGGGGNQQQSNPDPEPSPSRPADRGGECGKSTGSEGGPYDHDNCDGGAGDHGGGGNGKCAGCTGRSDDKSPGGQFPGDGNKGYECDHNKGSGKGNPAHSQCRPKPNQSTPPPGGETPPPGTTPPPPQGTNPPIIDTPSPSDSVQGEIITNPDDEPPGDEVLPRGPERRAQGEGALPFTGAGKALFVVALLGGAAVIAGVALSRRKKITP